MRYRTLAWPLVLILAVGLVACADGAESGPGTDDASPQAESPEGEASELDELVEAAQDEGTVVWYAGIVESIVAETAAGFTEKYGIEVDYVRMVSGDIAQRYSAEADAGNIVADVTTQSHSQFIPDSIENGWMVSIFDAGIPDFPEDYPEDFMIREDGTAVVTTEPFGIGYNSDLVSEDEAPQDWEDLLDPKWENEIVLVDPTSAPSYAGLWDAVLEEYGEDYLRALGQQVRRLGPSLIPTLEAVGAGEGALSVPSMAASVAAAVEQGAPLVHVQPDFAVGPEFTVGLTAEPPHPNAAQLFVRYIYLEEGQEILHEQEGPVSPYTGEGLPAEFQRPRRESLDPERQQLIRELLDVSQVQ